MEFKIVKDFLPPPEMLALRSENVKVTIQLSKASIEFFKKWAQKKRSHYQTMIGIFSIATLLIIKESKGGINLVFFIRKRRKALI